MQDGQDLKGTTNSEGYRIRNGLGAACDSPVFLPSSKLIGDCLVPLRHTQEGSAFLRRGAPGAGKSTG